MFVLRGLFRGLIDYTEEEFKFLWEEAHFVIDTNILINFLKYTSQESYSTFLKLLEKVKSDNRLYIPHQVALEYLYNYRDNMDKQEKGINDLVEKLSGTKEVVNKYILQVKSEHPYIKDDVFKFYLQNIEYTNKVLEQKREELMSELPDMGAIHLRILNLMEGIVGNPFEQEKIDEIELKGKDRYEKEIPPGWMDKKEKNDKFRYYGDLKYNQQFGDLIVWMQILDYAEEKNVPVIFVTEDNKEDWWNKKPGKILGPQPFLIQEFYNRTNKLFYMYKAVNFVKYAVKYLEMEITEKSIADISEQYENIRLLDSNTILSKRRERNRGKKVGIPPNYLERYNDYLEGLLTTTVENEIPLLNDLNEYKNIGLNIEDMDEFVNYIPPLKRRILLKWIEKVKDAEFKVEFEEAITLKGLYYFVHETEDGLRKECLSLINKFLALPKNISYVNNLMSFYKETISLNNVKIRLNKLLNIIETMEHELKLIEEESILKL